MSKELNSTDTGWMKFMRLQNWPFTETDQLSAVATLDCYYPWIALSHDYWNCSSKLVGLPLQLLIVVVTTDIQRLQ